MIKIAKLNPLSITKYVMSVIGLILLTMAFYVYRNTQKFIEKANVTKGIVVELIVYESGDGNTYRPVVLFMTKEGKYIKFSPSGSSNPPTCEEGEIVEVLYDPLDPNKAKVNKFWVLWFFTVMSCSMGLIFTVIGFCFFNNTSNIKKRKSKIILKNSNSLKNNSKQFNYKTK